jgi:hypothetical protein
LKEEALDRTLWRTRFGRGYGPVVRQTAGWRGYGPVVRQTAEWMKGALDIHWTRRQVGHAAAVDAVAKRDVPAVTWRNFS